MSRVPSLRAPIGLALIACFGLTSAPATADDAPTRRLEEVDLTAPPPQLDYSAWGDQVYADGYKLIASRNNRMAYLRRSLTEVPEAVAIMDKRHYRQNLGTALLVSGFFLSVAGFVAQDQGITEPGNNRGTVLGVAGMGAGVVVFAISPRMGKATDLYNDWARNEGIPSWP